MGIHSVAGATCTKKVINFIQFFLRDRIQFGSDATGGSSEGPSYLCFLSKWQIIKCFFQARIFAPPLTTPHPTL